MSPRHDAVGLQLSHACLRAPRLDVDDRQPLDAEPQRRVRDRGARATGPEQDDALERRVRQAAREALGEAGGVGVVAGRAAVLEDHGVDRLQRGRVGREVVEVGTTACLHGCVTLSAAEAGDAGPLEEVADIAA